MVRVLFVHTNQYTNDGHVVKHGRAGEVHNLCAFEAKRLSMRNQVLCVPDDADISNIQSFITFARISTNADYFNAVKEMVRDLWSKEND